VTVFPPLPEIFVGVCAPHRAFQPPLPEREDSASFLFFKDSFFPSEAGDEGTQKTCWFILPPFFLPFLFFFFSGRPPGRLWTGRGAVSFPSFFSFLPPLALPWKKQWYRVGPGGRLPFSLFFPPGGLFPSLLSPVDPGRPGRGRRRVQSPLALPLFSPFPLPPSSRFQGPSPEVR